MTRLYAVTFSFLMAIVSCLIFATVAYSASPKAVDKNNSGVESLKEEDYYSAFEHFTSSLAESPMNPKVHVNLGLAYLKNEEFEKALGEFETAADLSRKNPNVEFESLFNAGVASSKLGSIDQSLTFYQKALALRPDSKKVKTNIELLWRQKKGKGGKNSNKKENSKKNGDKDQKPQKGDQKDKEDKKNKGEIVNRRKQPQPFKSKQLSKDDVRKILDELKSQEQKIRAKQYDDSKKEAPNEKNW